MGNNGKGQATAGLILGIVALASALLIGPFLNAWFCVLALPIAIVGLVLSVIGGKKLKTAGAPAGIGTAGLVVGIIAVVLSAICFFTCGLCVICVTAAANEINKGYGEVNDFLNSLQ